MIDSSALQRANVVGHHGVAGRSAQDRYDCAIIMPTILRPSILRAVRSILEQDLDGTIQIMIGVDGGHARMETLQTLISERPDNIAFTVVDPGYSTCRLRGGMHGAFDGGALRTILSYAANSAYLANLDDDNWWAPDHLSGLVEAIKGKDWAFSLRWYVADDGETLLCPDEWESIGPGKGAFLSRFGGFSDTNTMLIDKTRVDEVLRLWSIPVFGEDKTGIGSDRNVFNVLKERPFGESGNATSYYVLDTTDVQHSKRVNWVRNSLGRNFDGYKAFIQGRFADAAHAFGRYFAIGPRSGLGVAWLALTRARAGIADDIESYCDQGSDADTGDERNKAIEVLAGRLTPDASYVGEELCCLIFFAGERALLDGDSRRAKQLFEVAANTGVEGQMERAAAAGELERLRKTV